jgi:hypothetical protein
LFHVEGIGGSCLSRVHVWPALTPDVKGVNVSRSRQSSMTISLHPQNLDTTQAGSADALDVKHQLL